MVAGLVWFILSRKAIVEPFQVVSSTTSSTVPTHVNVSTIKDTPQFVPMGCYGDNTTNQAMEITIFDEYVTPETCALTAMNRGIKYVGFQDLQPDGKVKCFGSNEITRARQYGAAESCYLFEGKAGMNIGGRLTNGVYGFLMPGESQYKPEP